MFRKFCNVNKLISRSYVLRDQNEPFYPKPGVNACLTEDADKAFSSIKDGAKVFIQGAAATPTLIAGKFYNYVKKNNIKNVKVYHIHTEGEYFFNKPEDSENFRSVSLFTGGNCRNAISEGRADYVPIFLSQIPALFREKHIELDLALISVSPPDRHGFSSLGPSVDIVRSAIQNSKCIVAQSNSNMPLTRGDASIHSSNIDYLMPGKMPLHEMKIKPVDEIEMKIGKYIAENLVVDGATLQMGIGSIPDAVLSLLGNHKDLGIHTEMFSDGLVDLVATGAVSNRFKKFGQGKIVSSFVMGTNKTFDFLDNNPLVEMRDIAWVNSPVIIAQNPKVTAINSCIEIDLTGQVCSDSIGSRVYSGFGGQVDFIRGAAISEDGKGKPIIALPSVTKRKESKIVPTLKQGAGVVTTRAHVHYVITEYGIAYLFGKTLRQRAHALIKIAHPDHRETLERQAFEILKVMPSAE